MRNLRERPFDFYQEIFDILMEEELDREQTMSWMLQVIEAADKAGQATPDALNDIATKVLAFYNQAEEGPSGRKDQAFWLLEVLAAKTGKGKSVAREAIMDLAGQGDERAIEKMARLRQIDPQSPRGVPVAGPKFTP